MRSMIWSAVLVHLKGRALAFQILIHSSSAVASSRKPTARRWADRRPMTLPVAVFSAANRSMVPCRS